MIPLTEPYITGKEKKYLLESIKSNCISTGKYVELFEKEFATFVGSKYAVSVCNGTCGLHLALKVLEVENYNNVIIPNYTFVATAEAVKYCTDDEELYKRMVKLRHHGESPTRYYHEEIGFNYRMSNINAAFGFAQLQNIEKIIKLKTRIKNRYDMLLLSSNLLSNGNIKIQQEYTKSETINWLYTIEFKNAHMCKHVVHELNINNIETRYLFYPINCLPPYGKNKCNSEDLCNRVINLPSSPELRFKVQKKIINIIEGALKNE